MVARRERRATEHLHQLPPRGCRVCGGPTRPATQACLRRGGSVSRCQLPCARSGLSRAHPPRAGRGPGGSRGHRSLVAADDHRPQRHPRPPTTRRSRRLGGHRNRNASRAWRWRLGHSGAAGWRQHSQACRFAARARSPVESQRGDAPAFPRIRGRAPPGH